jgi:hypothetical protein
MKRTIAFVGLGVKKGKRGVVAPLPGVGENWTGEDLCLEKGRETACLKTSNKFLARANIYVKSLIKITTKQINAVVLKNRHFYYNIFSNNSNIFLSVMYSFNSCFAAHT